MKLEQSFEVAAPLERVWKALVDVEHVAPCLPGAAVTGRNDDGSYVGTFTVKIGPTTASYTGTLQMENVDEATHSATMHAHGSDKRGQGGANADIFSALTPTDNGTHVAVITDYHITGRLARFGRGGMIEDISARLLRQFAERLQASLVEDGGGRGAEAQAALGREAAPGTEAEVGLGREAAPGTEAEVGLGREAAPGTEAEAALGREAASGTEAQAALGPEAASGTEAEVGLGPEAASGTEAQAAPEREAAPGIVAEVGQAAQAVPGTEAEVAPGTEAEAEAGARTPWGAEPTAEGERLTGAGPGAPGAEPRDEPPPKGTPEEMVTAGGRPDEATPRAADERSRGAAARPAQPPEPLDAVPLVSSVLTDRIRRNPAPAALFVGLLIALLIWRSRRRSA